MITGLNTYLNPRYQSYVLPGMASFELAKVDIYSGNAFNNIDYDIDTGEYEQASPTFTNIPASVQQLKNKVDVQQGYDYTAKQAVHVQLPLRYVDTIQIEPTPENPNPEPIKVVKLIPELQLGDRIKVVQSIYVPHLVDLWLVIVDHIMSSNAVGQTVRCEFDSKGGGDRG